MRHTDKPSDPLGQTIWNFRGKYHLSRKEAAKELGIGYVTLFSMERGYDQRTGLPFKPRESTLRQLAAKMTEFGYPVSLEEWMVIMEKTRFGERLHQELDAKGWTPYRLAKESGANQSLLSRIIRGLRPGTYGLINKILPFFSVSREEWESLVDADNLGDVRIERLQRSVSEQDPAETIQADDLPVPKDYDGQLRGSHADCDEIARRLIDEILEEERQVQENLPNIVSELKGLPEGVSVRALTPRNGQFPTVNIIYEGECVGFIDTQDGNAWTMSYHYTSDISFDTLRDAILAMVWPRIVAKNKR